MPIGATAARTVLAVRRGLVMLSVPGLAGRPGFAQGRVGGNLVVRLEAVDILPREMALDHLLDIV